MFVSVCVMATIDSVFVSVCVMATIFCNDSHNLMGSKVALRLAVFCDSHSLFQ